ncbi:MAG: bifunctional adenosylcobinamide kinase/adenosylcobinamide-phosphate guanylyltransferase [Lachnospiraceae bacterium]|nr:bifunctional adenosylcobinamide kinase/adenosylcobinamide-phosphate guanylyltransferase [Lachnospiraceae bacterium]
MIAIIGRPNSGKSAKAEEMALKTGLKPYYLATMKVMDESGQKRVQKHREMRAGKGFATLEIPYRIEEAIDLMDDPKNSVLLLECAANLVGNAMHEERWYEILMRGEEQAADRFVRYVTDMILQLNNKVGTLIVVSSEYELDEADDAETALYKRLLHEVNESIRSLSLTTMEVM